MSATVLVLEQGEGTRELYIQALEEAGHVALGAASIDEALQVSKSFHLQVAVCDLALVGDVRLRVVDILREKHPKLRVILLGPAPDPALLHPGDEHLGPPVRPEQLVEALKRLHVTRAGAFLSTLMAMPRKLLSKADSLRREQALELLERERSRVFQGLHVAIWSNLLNVGAGLDVWDRIADLEQVMARLRATPGASGAELLALANRYQSLFDLMTAMAQSGSVGAHRPRAAGEVDRSRLQCLFERVKDGYVSRDLLHESWILWTAPPEQRDPGKFARCWDPEASFPSPRAKRPKTPQARTTPPARKTPPARSVQPEPSREKPSRREPSRELPAPPPPPARPPRRPNGSVAQSQIALGVPIGADHVVSPPPPDPG